MFERSNDYLCPGADPEILLRNLRRAIHYWSNNTRALLPELPQIMSLHDEIFRDYFVEGVPGVLKTTPNYIKTQDNPPMYVHFSGPRHVADDYSTLREQAAALLEQMDPQPVQDPEPDNPNHWPQPDDQQAWIDRARFISYFHAHFIYIHPFRDGNGRVARLIAWEQARRLFPAVCRVPHGPAEVDHKHNSHVHFPHNGGAATTAEETYNSAMRALRLGAIDYQRLMRYFMFQPNITVPTTPPQGTPEFHPTYERGQIGPRNEPLIPRPPGLSGQDR